MSDQAKLEPTEHSGAGSAPRGEETSTNPTTKTEEGPGQEAAKQQTYTEMASNATANATAAAAGVKDSVFSMFGGGAKKEKKVEPEDDEDEPSGSSKAKKADAEEVGIS